MVWHLQAKTADGRLPSISLHVRSAADVEDAVCRWPSSAKGTVAVCS